MKKHDTRQCVSCLTWSGWIYKVYLLTGVIRFLHPCHKFNSKNGTDSEKKVRNVMLVLCCLSHRKICHISCEGKEITEVIMIEPPPGIFSFLNAKLQLCIWHIQGQSSRGRHKAQCDNLTEQLSHPALLWGRWEKATPKDPSMLSPLVNIHVVARKSEY